VALAAPGALARLELGPGYRGGACLAVFTGLVFGLCFASRPGPPLLLSGAFLAVAGLLPAPARSR
jgi:hypothetical protein